MSTICDTFLITKYYHCSQTMDLHAYISIHHCKLVLRSFCSACSATKRRPIKGAAGRPVQFKYPEMPLLSPTTLERQEIQQRLVPLWVQIVVFLLVVCLLYLIYASMEEPLSNPFTALLEGLQEAALIYTSED